MIDINFLRSFFTLLLFITFLGLFFLVYHTKMRDTFHEASLLPFDRSKE